MNSRTTETFVAQTVIGGKLDGTPLTGNITFTNKGEQIANFSTNLLDNSAPLKYNREASNLTVYQLKKGS